MNIAIFGIGNVLVGDDAVGPTVVTLLDALWEFPEGVVVEDIGTPSLDLAARLSDFDAAIFVDAVAVKAEPGTIRIFNRDQILKNPPGLRISPHDPSLKETLLTVEFLGAGPKTIRLVGVVPESTRGFGMSDSVQSAIPKAAQAVLTELEGFDIVPTPRAQPRSTIPWWRAA
ncbi:MAG TPA: hydrogenase maturation protease [Thermoanaerobaculia bacterium]|nr:hydrogenase maturation protease [Thermoanaerobaculia bacterium]